MADILVLDRSARARASSPTEQHFAAHNALSLAMLYLNRGNLPAARRKAVQALATIRQMREVAHG